MNNKKILGLPITLFVIVMLVIGGATAALVTYLSNSATMSVDVTSPTSIHFATIDSADEWSNPVDGINNVDAYSGSDWEEDIDMTSTGLSTEYVGVRIMNNADVAISGKTLSLKVYNNNSDVTCADITSLTFIDVGCSVGTSCYQVVQELVGIGLCTENSGVITYNVPINYLSPGQVFKYPVTLTFGNVAPAEYNFNATLMDY